MKIKRLNEMEEEDKGRKGVVLKINEEEQTNSSNNEDESNEDEDMALVDFSNKKFQELVLENKKLCEKVLSLEKCMVDYNDLKKKMNDLTILTGGCSSKTFPLPKDEALVLLDLKPVTIIIRLDALHGGLASRSTKSKVFSSVLDELPTQIVGRVLVELGSLNLTAYEVSYVLKFQVWYSTVESGFASFTGRTTLDFVSKSVDDSYSCKLSSRVLE
ncbi:hypothetical protein M9H77_22863 [Catharanthus roseus]|uniref:Uncharacterized protein n=1 Tax=Catharanthus roseus TaxID=4058 RepID=A0ACC0AT65_CATRO|nr:hypothetical protein M9H77_22863 [Catharanthus roseus]